MSRRVLPVEVRFLICIGLDGLALIQSVWTKGYCSYRKLIRLIYWLIWRDGNAQDAEGQALPSMVSVLVPGPQMFKGIFIYLCTNVRHEARYCGTVSGPATFKMFDPLPPSARVIITPTRRQAIMSR